MEKEALYRRLVFLAMNHTRVRRSPRRKAGIVFEFTSNCADTFRVKADDASIRAARFAPSEKERIINAEKSAKAFFASNIPTVVKRILPHSDPSRKENDGFVINYKSCQYENGTRIRGNRASYEVMAFIGAGQSAETYRARVTDSNPGVAGLRVGDDVVVKIPLFDPCLRSAELIDLSSNLVTLFIREEASLLRLSSLDCVASFLDTGSHKFPRDEVPETRLMVQRFVEGKSLDEYLRIDHSDPKTGHFVGLRAADFYLLGRKLAEAVRKAHSKLVVHGDIWPENILVRPNGEPILIDFGQAVFREAIGISIDIAGRNSRYIAPEKARSVGGDIYSLGGVLHYLATGEDPPEEPSADIDSLKTQITDTVRRTNEQLYQDNRGAVDIIAHCLRTSDQRIAHAHGVIEELDTFFGERAQSTVSEALRPVATEGARLDNSGHELFRWMAGLRVNALRATLSDMASGVYDLVGDHEVIVAGLTQYLGLLGERDEYLTISVPKFWYPRNLGVNGRFLSMNTVAAQRGAVIKRLFVITETDRKAVDFQSMIDAQRRVLSEVRALSLRGRYEVRVYETAEDEGKDIMRQGHHFGLIVRRVDEIEDEVAIFPEYRADGSLAAVRFRAKIATGLRETFDEYWHKASELT